MDAGGPPQQAPKIRIGEHVVAMVGRSWQRPNQKIQPLPGDATSKCHCGVKKDVPFFENHNRTRKVDFALWPALTAGP